MNEKRRFCRISFDSKARLCGPTECVDSHLIDISLKGALIARPPEWSGQTGDHYTLELALDGSDLTITMEVSVAHIDATHIGCRCEHIDIDSISHLRRLVELNIGDEAVLDRELHALIGVA